MSDVIFRVDNEIARVDVVALQHLFEQLGLVHRAFFHEGNNLILLHNCVFAIVVQLNLHFVLQLPGFRQKRLGIDIFDELLVILGNEVRLANVGPGVVFVAHWVLGPDPHVLASSEEEEFVDFAVEGFPVHNVGHPGGAARTPEESAEHHPVPAEGVHEVPVDGEGDERIVHNVRVFEVDDRVLDVIARVEQDLSLSVEFNRLGRLIYFICAL